MEPEGITFDDLPGGTWVRKGLGDLEEGNRSLEALALRVYSIRLKSLGFGIDRTELAHDETSAEGTLYAALRADGLDAYNRYNAMLRELNSFLEAVESLRGSSASAA